jgi:quercetin 2,3-dioxygenase
MITLRRAGARHHARRHQRDVWSTFDPRNRADPLADGFGTLEILSEDRLPPAMRVPHRRGCAEIVTYVHEGAIAYDDSNGRSGVVHAGEFQYLAAGRSIQHGEANASRIEWAHVFRIRLRASQDAFETVRDQKRFSAAERRGGFCVVASPDARRGSLRIQQDAVMYSALLEPGQHVVHELAPGRRAWLHLVQGDIACGDITLATGDGLGVTCERVVSLTARDKTELLLLDLGDERAAQDLLQATS